jgi:hypothetical protein
VPTRTELRAVRAAALSSRHPPKREGQLTGALIPSARAGQRLMPAARLAQDRTVGMPDARATGRALPAESVLEAGGILHGMTYGPDQIVRMARWGVGGVSLTPGAAEEIGVADYRAAFDALARAAPAPDECIKLIESILAELDRTGTLEPAGVLRKVSSAASELTLPDSLPETVPDTSRSRDRQRIGNLVYCIAFIVAMLAYMGIVTEGKTEAEIVSFANFAAGAGAHQIALRAREIALRHYDRAHPPE